IASSAISDMVASRHRHRETMLQLEVEKVRQQAELEKLRHQALPAEEDVNARYELELMRDRLVQMEAQIQQNAGVSSRRTS
ncbi:MAG: hypothetical protein C4320_04870, partial [Armatimonadota bacterium]